MPTRLLDRLPDAATLLGTAPARRLEIPLLAQVPRLAHLFTVRGSDPRAALQESAGAALPLRTLRQVHGADVRVFEGPPQDGPFPADVETGDALVISGAGTACGVFVADCLPILICDDRTRVAAAVHAGWRGTVAGVLARTLAILRERFGASPADLRLAFGPAIGSCCFEVGPEVVRSLLESRPEAASSILPGPRARIDLAEANRLQALAAGVRDDRIQAAGLCTRCRPDLLPSYRRDGAGAGRIAGVIAWTG